MSEIVLVSGEGEAMATDRGSLFERTSIWEKALVVITALGVAYLLTEITYRFVSLISVFAPDTLISRITALAVWVIPGLFLSLYCQKNPYSVHSFARVQDVLYLFKRKLSDSDFSPTICQLVGVHMGTNDQVWVTSGDKIDSLPYVIVYHPSRKTATVYDFCKQSKVEVNLQQVSRVAVLKNMLVCLEEGRIEVRDLKGNSLGSLGSDIVDFSLSEDKIVAFSKSGALKVYSLFSPIYQAIPYFLGKERGDQYQFPCLLQAEDLENTSLAQPVMKGYVMKGSHLIQYETGKVWKFESFDQNVTPVMVDDQTVAYCKEGKVYLYNLEDGKKIEVPANARVTDLKYIRGYLLTFDESNCIRSWELQKDQAVEAKTEISKKDYEGFMVGDECIGALALSKEGVDLFWEDGGIYQRPLPVFVSSFKE